MVGLGLKLEGLLKQKGLKNEVTNSFHKLVDEPPVGLQNSAKPIVTENEHVPINRREVLQNSAELSDSKNIDIPIKDQVDARKEIANYANTSHD